MSKKNLKKMLVVAMAMVMLFGNTLSVLAVDYNYDELTVGRELTDEDSVIFTGYNAGPQVYYDDTRWNSNGDGEITIINDNMTLGNGKIYYVKNKERTPGTTPAPILYLSTTPIVPATPSTAPGEAQRSNNSGHSHNFQWKVVKEPTLNEDGLAQSVCECGAVEGQQPISAATAFVKMVCDAIETAPEGATVEVETDIYTCYTAKIMEKLKTRPDIAFKTTFMTEEKTWKTFTIPAGQAPTDGELFYGFTYLGILYGWGDCDHVHDEACGGEDDCTHVHDKNY